MPKTKQPKTESAWKVLPADLVERGNRIRFNENGPDDVVNEIFHHDGYVTLHMESGETKTVRDLDQLEYWETRIIQPVRKSSAASIMLTILSLLVIFTLMRMAIK